MGEIQVVKIEFMSLKNIINDQKLTPHKTKLMTKGQNSAISGTKIVCSSTHFV